MHGRLNRLLRSRRWWVVAAFDAGSWILALGLFAVLRHDLAQEPVPWSQVLVVSAVAVVLHLLLGWVVRLHLGRATLGTFEEMLLLGGVIGTVGAVITAGNAVLSPPLLPRSVPVAAAFTALVMMACGRAAWRRLKERGFSAHGNLSGTPALVVGAGDAGQQLIDSIRRDPSHTWHIVGLIDDDPLKSHLRVRGIPVRGTRADIERVAAHTGATTLLVAIPSASADLMRRLSAGAKDLNLDVKVLPGMAELFDARVGITDLRDIDVTDLLGRHQIDTDINSMAGYLTDRRVLVTGAGGSIGSELCRQIHRFGPSELMMLDRDGSALHAVQLSIHGRAMLDSDEVILADIRDGDTIREIFRQRRPDVVFHAAALKHLPMLEQYPAEAVQTNVIGTLTVLEAAEAAGVQRFVNISTDKAANPCSVLGYSKRIAEGLTAGVAAHADGTFMSVRFGNVLGSRGSVLTAFAAQIAAGGPVTVTHPEVTRYFMTIAEACQLVIQAAAIGRDGEALVLDMGKPVAIKDVAEQLIAMDGGRISIEYTGLRDGEKMHEDLLGDDEPDERPVHPLVSHVSVPEVLEPHLHDLRRRADVRTVTMRLAARCGAMTAENRSLRH
jgi:FlaA1/EpsC-like NDP-sugar epimerase